MKTLIIISTAIVISNCVCAQSLELRLNKGKHKQIALHQGSVAGIRTGDSKLPLPDDDDLLERQTVTKITHDSLYISIAGNSTIQGYRIEDAKCIYSLKEMPDYSLGQVLEGIIFPPLGIARAWKTKYIETFPVKRYHLRRWKPVVVEGEG